MLPGKRSAGGEEVVDESLIKRTKIDNLISSAATASTSTGTSSTVATMGGGNNNSNGTTNGKLPIGGAGESNQSDIDEDLHSRQLAVYGRETMRRLFASNVLVSGMQGLGAEIGEFMIEHMC